MQSRVLRRLALTVVLGVGVAMGVASTAEARPSRPSPRSARSGFNLFQGAKSYEMNVNRIQCDVDNRGQVCTNPLGGGSLEDGTWPKGSPDTYIFNGGLQVAGTVLSATPFKWSGDTVGAFFMDPRGEQRNGEGLTDIFSSTNLDDLNNWPDNAVIRDTSLFDASLIGRQTISQQDLWVRYWDGNPNLGQGRKHPMGVMVEQRAVGWNFPSGNEDIMYVMFRFINITASDPTKYAGLSVAGYTAPQIAEIAAVGARFASSMNQTYNITIPPGGYTFHNMFADFFQDADEGNFQSNYSTPILPFAMAHVYKSDFLEPLWAYPGDIFGAPFAAAPGVEGVKYLKSPINPATGKPFGISIWSNTTNSAVFPDPVGVSQMYRYISGTVSPALGDRACQAPNPVVDHYCAAVQTPDDTRFFMSSGPFDLAPGQSSVIVVAIIFAAPVGSLPADATGPKPLPAFSLAQYIGKLPGMVPGFPSLPDRLAAGLDTVRTIERVDGWQAYHDLNADGVIDQTEVVTTPRSLLRKALVAQAVFDSRFLLPFAPEPPEFFVIPGDGQVTIAWKQSPTEDLIKGGDPYFKVASDVTNSLYDPNYRKFDVEGYRIWRGRTAADMHVIQQFDYAGTTFYDVRGLVWTAGYGNQCAPELGLTLSCPSFVSPGNPVDIASPFIQFKPGDRGLLSPGIFTDTTAAGRTVTWIKSDTAVTGGGSGYPAMTDNGVPFVFIDNTVRNGFTYYYAVTTFDINSVSSSPSSLQSGLVAKPTTPRAPSTNNQPAVIVVGEFGGDGTLLDATGAFPKLDAATGTLTGPVPPANGGVFQFLASVAEVLPTGEFGIRVDSVSPGFFAPAFGTPPTLYMAFFDNTTSYPVPVVLPTLAHGSSVAATASFSFNKNLVPYDTARARTLGINAAFALANKFPVSFTGTIGSVAGTGTMVATAFGRYGDAGTNQTARFFAHSYWSDQGSAPPPDPTINPFGSAAHTSGKLTGITAIWEPLAYRQPISGGAAAGELNVNFRGVNAAMSSAWYPGDFLVTWGAGGSVTVFDSTHRVTVPFKKSFEPGYGFLDLAAMVAAGVVAGDVDDGTGSATMTSLSYQHLYSVNPACTPDWWGITCVPLRQTAVVTPLDFNADGVSEGTGFVLVINGEPFFMVGAIPASGTKWHLTSYGGGSMSATCTPALPASGFFAIAGTPTDCSAYSFTAPAVRPAFVPGLKYKIRVTQGFSLATASGDISRIHTVPDPYYVTNALETTQNGKVLRFVNLPSRAIIRIYSASGILLRIITHNDIGGGGDATWDLRNRNNQFVASGVYFYHVETPDGLTKIGRFTVVNFAQ